MNFKKIIASAVSFALAVQAVSIQVIAEDEIAALERPDSIAENQQQDLLEETSVEADEGETLSDDELLQQVDELVQNYDLPEVGVGFIELTPEQTEAVVRSIDEQNAGEYEICEDYKASLYTFHNDYFRNQLNSDEKNIYDSWVKICSDFMVSTNDIEKSYPDYIIYDPEAVSKERAQQIVTYAYYDHPEFFFLHNGNVTGTYGTKMIIGPYIMDSFKSGSARSSTYSEITDITIQWMNEVNKLPNDLAKEKYIAETICNTVTYIKNYPEDQSLYGSLIRKEAVCNGYAMEMSYFCNAAGIDCITVVSNTHAWNNVNLFGEWYIVDTTWMDQITYIYYKWFNINTETMLQRDSGNSHVIDTSKYTNIVLPSCTKLDPQVPAESSVAINDANFPDDTFRSYVSQNFDKDNNGELSQSELNAVTSINVAGTENKFNTVADLTGIGYFKNLSSLDCSYNQLTGLDLSENTALKTFNCKGNSYAIGIVSKRYYLDNLPNCFDAAKASYWRGAEYNSASNLLQYFISDTAVYNYDCGNGYTATFKLKANFVIQYQPADTSVIEGLDTSLTVSVVGSDLTYRWQEYSDGKWYNISGAESSELVLDNAAYNMNGRKYRCNITRLNAATVSSTAVLTVIPAESVTASEVADMSSTDAAKFVNAFTARYNESGKDCYVLNAAQVSAIETVLANDFS